MAVGFPTKVTYANGDVFSASDINDTNGTINLLGASVAYSAGKNKIINGDFYVNQRNFTSATTDGAYGFDRWMLATSTGSTYTPQTFTAGTAPVTGYEGKNFAQLATAGQSGASDLTILIQKIEDVRTLANQTATISFWAKAASGTPKVSVEVKQGFGSGGSADVNTYAGQATLSTSWARYTVSVTVPSISGKTIGTGSSLQLFLWTSAGSTYNSRTNSLGIQNATISFWGVQIENGSTATAFQTATGTIQGELAACQRYYWRNTPGTAYGGHSAIAITNSSTSINIVFNNPTSMRVQPTSIDFGNLAVFDTSVVTAISSLSIVSSQSSIGTTYVSAGGTGLGSLGRVQYVLNNNNTAGYFGASAEL
jgi:hypothetical protein